MVRFPGHRVLAGGKRMLSFLVSFPNHLDLLPLILVSTDESLIFPGTLVSFILFACVFYYEKEARLRDFLLP